MNSTTFISKQCEMVSILLTWYKQYKIIKKKCIKWHKLKNIRSKHVITVLISAHTILDPSV